MRPFYFGVVFWGEEFRSYFLDYCLSSLLAPGNIPALENKTANRFLICTTAEDWEQMKKHRTFLLLENEMQPVYLNLDDLEPSHDKMRFMSRGHKAIACKMHEDRAYGTFIYPDTIFSDGVVVHLQRLAGEGKKVVVAHCPRFANEGFLEQLKSKRLLETGSPLSLKGQELLRLAMPHMHSETRRYEWEASYFHGEMPALIWWRVDQESLVIHSFTWAPLLFDYEQVKIHDTKTLEHWTIDGDYIYQNISSLEDVHVETDPEVMTLLSFTPESSLTYLPLNPKLLMRLPVVGTWYRKLCLRNVLNAPQVDPLKRQLFRLPVYVPKVLQEERVQRLNANIERLFQESSKPLTDFEQRMFYWLRIVNEGIGQHLGYWVARRPFLNRVFGKRSISRSIV
ncbi:MAG: hypothetical protein MRJ96_11730 [Nitrospirales bacterium]|nr:hypothetical protein [Nitrospira sp.]MDR4502110.1 hypothetical protein [Nitrospirales bacterium]